MSLTGPKRPQKCPVQTLVHRKKLEKVYDAKKVQGVKSVFGGPLKSPTRPRVLQECKTLWLQNLQNKRDQTV